MSKDYRQIEIMYGKEVADNAFRKEQQDLARVDKAKNNAETMKALAIGMSVVSAVGLAGKAYEHFSGNNAPTPNEKPGDHHGSVSNNKPGSGNMFSNGRNFSVTQTTENAGGIGTAAAAEKRGDHFVEVDPITFAPKK